MLAMNTNATPPADMFVATAFIRNHGALFIMPRSQKDRTDFALSEEAKQQEEMPTMMLSQYIVVTEARDQMGKFVLDLVCFIMKIWGKIGQERPTLFDPYR